MNLCRQPALSWVWQVKKASIAENPTNPTRKDRFCDADIASRAQTSTGSVIYTRTGVGHGSCRPNGPAGQFGPGWVGENKKENEKKTRRERGERLGARCLELADRQLMMSRTLDKGHKSCSTLHQALRRIDLLFFCGWRKSKKPRKQNYSSFKLEPMSYELGVASGLSENTPGINLLAQLQKLTPAE